MLVSVIVTCHNLERYVTRAVHSCLNQTLDDSQREIVVVDDASTDASWDRIRDFGPLVKAIRLDENLGVAAASNAGIRAASGEYVVRVDADDYVNRNFLLSLSEVLEWNDDIGFVYCDHILVENDRETRTRSINTLDRLLDHGAGVMFRKRYLEAVGLYDESLRNCEDYDLLTRYMRNFDGYHLRLPYYRYTKRDGSLSTRIADRTAAKLLIDERNTH